MTAHVTWIRLLTAVVVLGCRSLGLAPQAPYAVGPNIQITHADSGRSVLETSLCVDPRNARRSLAGAIVEDGDTTANAFFVSSDEGATWSSVLSVPHSVDPSCAIAADGVLYAVSVHDSMPTGASYLNVQRSADGGRSWTESVVQSSARSLDRAYVTAGDGQSVYVHAYVQAPVLDDGRRGPAVAVLYTSTDAGRTFARAATIPGAVFQTPWFFPANGVVTSDGAFTGLIVELDNTQRNMFRGRSDSASAPHATNGVLRVIRSRDRATVDVSTVGDAFYDWRVPQLSMASLAIDQSTGPFQGRLYAVWPDARFDRRTQILLSRSADAGRTWSTPQVVSDTPALRALGHRPNDFMPMAAVNRDGVVGVSWYDRRDNPDNLSYWPRFVASLDGGDSWLPSTRASTSPNVLTSRDRHLNGGDTSGLAADASGLFHLVWIDNRTGVPQAWTTTVKVNGAAQRPER